MQKLVQLWMKTRAAQNFANDQKKMGQMQKLFKNNKSP